MKSARNGGRMSEKDKKHSPAASGRRSRPVWFFRWKRRKDFTMLEDAVIRAIEIKGALSDEEIAAALCLEAGDVAIVLHSLDKEYQGDVQGDFSRRSLCDDFSRDLPNGFAVVATKKNKNLQEFSDDDGEMDNFLNELRESPAGECPEEIAKFIKEQKECRCFVAEVSFCENGEEPDFRCDNKPIPAAARPALEKLRLWKGKGKK